MIKRLCPVNSDQIMSVTSAQHATYLSTAMQPAQQHGQPLQEAATQSLHLDGTTLESDAIDALYACHQSLR